MFANPMQGERAEMQSLVSQHPVSAIYAHPIFVDFCCMVSLMSCSPSCCFCEGDRVAFFTPSNLPGSCWHGFYAVLISWWVSRVFMILAQLLLPLPVFFSLVLQNALSHVRLHNVRMRVECNAQIEGCVPVKLLPHTPSIHLISTATNRSMHGLHNLLCWLATYASILPTHLSNSLCEWCASCLSSTTSIRGPAPGKERREAMPHSNMRRD